MRKKHVKRFLGIVLSAAMVVTMLPASAVAAPEEAVEEIATEEQVGADVVEVRDFATPSVSYVGWGMGADNFADSSMSTFWNGHSDTSLDSDDSYSQWMMYDFGDNQFKLTSCEINFNDDGGGVMTPTAITIEYWNVQTEAWSEVTPTNTWTCSSASESSSADVFEFEAVETTKLRVTMEHATVSGSRVAVAVYDWKVYSEITDSIADLILDYAKENLSVSAKLSSSTNLTQTMYDVVSVEWTEDHPAITIENGVAIPTRGNSDVEGTMTAVLSLNGKTATKVFNVTVPARTDQIEDMLAKYDFSDLSGSISAGSAITDVSGHDNDAYVRGTGVKASDGALVLPGGNYGSGAGYVELPTGMFDGQDNLTISMWIKNETGSSWMSAFFFGKNTTSYFMINPANGSTGNCKMVLTWSGSGSEIGTAPGSDLSAGPTFGSEWVYYTAVITPSSLTAYFNGEKYETYALSNSISDMGSNLVAYIGQSLYSDPFFGGQVKNVSIYSKAISDAEVGALYTDGMSEAGILENAASSLEISEATDNTLSTILHDSVTLPTSILSGLVTISWESSNEAIISTDGKVTAPSENAKVTLTATLKTGSTTLQKEITLLVLAKDATTYTMTLDQEDTGVDISQELFGLFYEDINSSADGGLSPELVKNNSFQNYADGSSATNPETYGDQTSWKKYWTSSNSSGFTIEQTDPLNENNTNYAKLTGNQTLSNVGYTEMWKNTTPSIPIEEGVSYDFSMWMKADAAYAGTITVQVTNASGTALTDVQTLKLVKDGTWTKISTVLTGKTKETGKLALTITGAATSDVIYVDMVSLASQNTYGYGNKNYAYGAGLRADLVEMLADLSPSFIRFPGGCAIEGDYGEDSFYNWENSIGPLEERKAQASYWGDYYAGKNADYDYGYMMSFELGYHEILTLCEDLGAEAFPIMSAGIYCQFISKAPAAKSGSDLDPYAQYAIDLLNYCWGNPLSSDPEEAEWAMKRVQNGHDDTFDLHYIGIGNENWNTTTVNYHENFTYIKNKIEAYVAEHYPDHDLTLIMAYGPYYWSASYDEDAYTYVKREMQGEVLMDEHYYAGASWMLSNTHRYDSYARLDEGGTNVFVGEYATNDQGNTLEGAIAEAAYMTGFERNGDIVRHASYAPLLAKEGAENWSPNLIYFDEYDVMATPNYYVQWMYANNYGETIVNTDLNKVKSSGSYTKLSTTQTDIYQVSSEDSKYIYLKLVNSDEVAKDITLYYPNVADGAEVEIICLTGDADDYNEIGDETVVPVTTKATVQNEQLQYVIPAMSANVVKVAYRTSGTTEPSTTPDPTGTPAPTTTPDPTGTPAPTHVSHVGKTFTVNGLKYKVTKDTDSVKEVRVTSMTKKTSTLTIPAKVTNSSWGESFKVTSIKAKAFKGSAITKVTIGKNVTKIGPNAFKGCTKLKTVVIGKSVKTIGVRAFYGCTKLTKVTIKSKVISSVKKNAFKKISKKAIIKVPAGKKAAYKKKLNGKIAKGVTIK